jgi:alkylation response protein AidB-like acyl-CoA dehydrogenase
MIIYVAQRLARVCIEDAMNYAHKRKVFGKRLIDSEVIRNKFAHMSRVVESQQAWIEVRLSAPAPSCHLFLTHSHQSVVYAIDNLSHEEANRRLGGTTALLKAHCSLVLEIVAREAVQVLGGIGHTRGGQGERIERIRRDVKGVSIPGVSRVTVVAALFVLRSENGTNRPFFCAGCAGKRGGVARLWSEARDSVGDGAGSEAVKKGEGTMAGLL